MTNYYEAEQELVDMVNSGEISQAEFRAEMRGLREEFQEYAEEAAEQAYNDAMGW